MSIVGYRVGETQVWWLKGCCVWVEVARCLCAAVDGRKCPALSRRIGGGLGEERVGGGW